MTKEIIMWGLIMLSVFLLFAGGIVYLTSRFCKFSYVRKLGGGRKWKTRFIAFLHPVLITLAASLLMSFINGIVVILHLMLIWLLTDLFCRIFRKAFRKDCKKYYRGAVVLGLTFLYLCYGFYAAHHVWKTEYALNTDKTRESLKILQFSDSHLGATFHWERFTELVEEMNAEDPDLVLITGDFVDDGSTREDMIKCCEALGKLKTGYGVYFSFGNHDKGYYGDQYRGFSESDLRENLEKNGVVILEDQVVKITEDFTLIGRQDKSSRSGRSAMETLMAEAESGTYTIVMDHQPNDYEAEAAAGADLVLSGHTHGGQMIPINHVGMLIGANDKAYGYERRENTDFIVSSGISDWELKFKTGCFSEYVLIEIN